MEVLLKLEWVKSEHEISRAAYLMFAKDTQRKFSQAIVHAGAFKAGGAVIIDSFDARGNIQTQVDATLAFIQRNIHCAIQTHPGNAAHEAVWDYPLEAVRETLANAICHRDYGSPHDVQVKVLEDMLQISSPGQLPFDMPLELLMNPLHASRPRNKIIAQAFFDMGIIEHYGRGIIRIKEECNKNGNPYPAWKDEYGSFVTEYLPRKDQSENLQTTTLQGQTTTLQGQTTTLPAQTTTVQEQIDTALPEELLVELESLGKKAPSGRIADLMVRLCEHRPMTKNDLMRYLRRGEATINRIAASLLGKRLAYRYPNMIHHPRQAYVAVGKMVQGEDR